MDNYWSYRSKDGSLLISFAISFTIQTELVPANISEIINDYLVFENNSIPLGISLIKNNFDVSAFQPNSKYY